MERVDIPSVQKRGGEQTDLSMGVRGCCSTREHMKPCSGVTMRMLVVMLVLLLFPALAFVSESFFFTPPDDGLPSLNRESNRVHAISSRSRLSRVVVPADNVDGEEEIAEDDSSKRHHSRKVRARRLNALVSAGECNTVATIFRLVGSRRMGLSNDPAHRPIKLVIICTDRGTRKGKKVGIKVSSASPREAPANQQVVPFANNQRRRALKQLVRQLPVPPLPFTLPSVPLISPPPQFRIPPLPPTPQFHIPPLPFPFPASAQPLDRSPPSTQSTPTLPVELSSPVLPLPGASVLPKELHLPPLPFQIPPLPFQIPPLPCVPASSGKSLPPP